MEPGTKVRALFDFETTEVNELSLKAGDIIEVTKQVDNNWLLGSCNGQTGSFPVNFVKKCEEESIPDVTPGTIYVAIETFKGSDGGDLSFQKGDRVEVLQRVDASWLYGKCGEATGMFPAVYVKEETKQTGNNVTGKMLARALQDISGQLDEELSFKTGDIITILEKLDSDWWKGSINGKTGILPALCVEEIEENNSSDVFGISEETDVGIPNQNNLNDSNANNAISLDSVDTGNVEPWAKSLFPFSAENNGELSFMDNEKIKLRKRIDDAWLEGEIQGKIGIFPANFVQVMVDVPPGFEPKSTTVSRTSSNACDILKPADNSLQLPLDNSPGGNSWKGKRARVLFDFNAESVDDLDVQGGEIITILEKSDEEWFQAKHPSGRKGFIPVNYIQILEKPRSPSSKRKAPMPPAKPRAINPSANSNSDELFGIDDLDQLASFGSRKPTLPPKPGHLSRRSPSASSNPSSLGDLLFLDPLSDADPPVIPPSKPNLPLPPKPAPLAFRPVPPPKKFSPTSDLNAESKGTQSNVKKTNISLLDMSSFDHADTDILQPIALQPAVVAPSTSLLPLQPSSSTNQATKYSETETEHSLPTQGSLDSPSRYNVLMTAKPYDASASASAQVRKVQSPVRYVAPKPEAAVDNQSAIKIREALLTLDEVSQDLDKAMDAGLSPFKSGSDGDGTGPVDDAPVVPPPVAPIPKPRSVMSPNPFSPVDTEEAVSSPTVKSVNPFSATTPPEEKMLPNFQSQTALSFPVQPLVPTPADVTIPPLGIPRDDSVQSDLSDDTFFQNISVTINPTPMQIPPQTSDSFLLPPPPTKGAITSINKPVIAPKPAKFDTKTAVPRPRGKIGSSSSEPPFTPPATNGSLRFNELVPLSTSNNQQNIERFANFESSVEQIFDTSKWEEQDEYAKQNGSQKKRSSVLDDDLAIVGQAVRGVSNELEIGDLLGVEGMAPPKPSIAKRKVPPRPSPPKKAPVAASSTEESILSHLRPESDISAVVSPPDDPVDELQETLAALQASIAEFKLEIQRQRDHKAKLERLLPDAVEDEKPEFEQQISDITGNLEHLQHELNSLQGQLSELQPDQIQLLQKKNLEFRNKVIKEILTTEGIYVQDIKLCQKGFMTVLEEKQAKGLELDVLFGNMEQVIEIAENFLKDLHVTVDGKETEEQFVGDCFMRHSQNLHEAYAQYCRNHDDATALLEKYEENPEVQEYINQGLELVRQSTNCWDLASFLIKPVQRILKYHLLLAELYKYTEEDHPDRPNIQLGLTTMTEVATSINEFKRRKDLVMKYRKPGQEAISDKLGKLNLHSIRKKSQRVNMRLSQVTGLATQTVDDDFDKAERRFRIIEKTMQIFVKDVYSYLEQLKEATAAEAVVGSDISDYYASQSNLHEVNKYEAVQRHLANKLYKDYTLFVQQRVISPLETLLNMFQGPYLLITKRYHKLLDYDSFIKKVEKTKDKERLKQLKDDKEVARKNYEALNMQLKDELPKLCDMALSMFKSCAIAFIEAERDHINSTLKKLYPLLELSIVENNDLGYIMDSFEKNHNLAIERLYNFSFVPNNFDKKDKTERRLSRRISQPPAPSNKPQPNKNNNQSESQRNKLEKRYPAERLYEVTVSYTAQQPMDISVVKGDMVGIIKEQDPTGGSDKWYIDNGASQGFAPSTILAQRGKSQSGINEFDSSEDDFFSGNFETSQQQYFYSEWPFQATSPNEISLDSGTVVRLVSSTDMDGNSDWWLVDRDGFQGYVPANYLAKIE